MLLGLCIGWSHATINQAHDHRYTHIDGYMTDYRSMVRQSDVVRIVFVVLALGRPWLLLVYDESPLNVDAHIARVLYRVLDIALRGSPSRASRLRGRRGVYRMRTRCFGAGFTRRGVQCRRHGCGCSGSWLQLRPLTAMAHAQMSSSFSEERVLRGRVCEGGMGHRSRC
jgi:hypothetical protein